MKVKDQERLKQILNTIGNEKNAFVDTEDFSKKLVSAGWTMMPTLGVMAANTIMNASDEDVDFLMSVYIEDEYQYESMINNIMNSSMDIALKKVVKEAEQTYQNSCFIVCGISLITVIEGALSEFLINKNSTDIKKMCEIEAGKHKAENSIKKVFWISCNDYIQELFKQSKFDKDEPKGVNRHWLLHGRSQYHISRIDCLKLFNAISCICLLMKNYLDNNGKEEA